MHDRIMRREGSGREIGSRERRKIRSSNRRVEVEWHDKQRGTLVVC